MPLDSQVILDRNEIMAPIPLTSENLWHRSGPTASTRQEIDAVASQKVHCKLRKSPKTPRQLDGGQYSRRTKRPDYSPPSGFSFRGRILIVPALVVQRQPDRLDARISSSASLRSVSRRVVFWHAPEKVWEFGIRGCDSRSSEASTATPLRKVASDCAEPVLRHKSRAPAAARVGRVMAVGRLLPRTSCDTGPRS